MKNTNLEVMIAVSALILVVAAELFGGPADMELCDGILLISPVNNNGGMIMFIFVLYIVLAVMIAVIFTFFFSRINLVRRAAGERKMNNTAAVFCLFYIIVMELIGACYTGRVILAVNLCGVLFFSVIVYLVNRDSVAK